MARSDQFTVGIDFGTLSGRAVVVRVSDGAELGSAVHDYAHGVLDTRLASGAVHAPAGLGAPGAERLPRGARATPCPRRCASPGSTPAQVVGIGTDFTACTVLPVLADGTPLCELPDYADRPHAYVKLWKHHAAQAQADRINELAHARGESWIGRYGGLISSEWEFAKGLQLLEEDPRALRPRWTTGSRRRTGSSGSSDRSLRPQRLHRRLQGDLPGRRATPTATSWRP